jgi:hypothetical protein
MGILMMLQWRNRDTINYLASNVGVFLESVNHNASAYLHFQVAAQPGRRFLATVSLNLLGPIVPM